MHYEERHYKYKIINENKIDKIFRAVEAVEESIKRLLQYYNYWQSLYLSVTRKSLNILIYTQQSSSNF